jgi:hypothetical protein
MGERGFSSWKSSYYVKATKQPYGIDVTVKPR